MGPRLLIVFALALCAPAAFAADPPSATEGSWPQWNGPNRDGRSPETGLLREWPKGGPEVVWKRKLGGGFSGIAVDAELRVVFPERFLDPEAIADGTHALTPPPISRALGLRPRRARPPRRHV